MWAGTVVAASSQSSGLWNGAGQECLLRARAGLQGTRTSRRLAGCWQAAGRLAGWQGTLGGSCAVAERLDPVWGRPFRH